MHAAINDNGLQRSGFPISRKCSSSSAYLPGENICIAWHKRKEQQNDCAGNQEGTKDI